MNLAESTTDALIAELSCRLTPADGWMRTGTAEYRRGAAEAGAAIVATVAREFGVDAGLVMSRARSARVVRARQVAMSGMWLAGYSYPEIGRFFSRDHGTIIHAVKKTGAAEISNLKSQNSKGKP